MDRTALQAARPRRFRPGLVALTALVAGACNVEDAVSPRHADGGAAQLNPPIVDAIRERIDATFTGGSKRKPVKGGRLAFTGFDGAVYTMEPDGFGLTRLALGYDPSWSPDGARIAFWRTAGNFGNGSDVYVMNADGGNVTLVARGGYQPTWSPDGKQLAFGCGGICVMNLDGSGRRIVTTLDARPAGEEQCVVDSDPTWSPNGRTIAFTRWPDTRFSPTSCLPLMWTTLFPFDFWSEVWFVESDGTGQRPLRGADGNPLTYAGWPAWSPDGSQVALYALNVGYEAIKVVNADGSGLRDVAHRTPANFEQPLGGPDWSPDGSQIVLGSGSGWGFVQASGSVSNPSFKAPFVFRSFGLWSWSRR